MNITDRLKNYKKLKAEIKNIELDIEELIDNISPKGICYDEKAAPTNAFNSDVENQGIALADKTSYLESLKRSKEREIERIDNALSILDDKEREVLTMKYINGFRWDTVTYKLDRSYAQCKSIEVEAIKKVAYLLKQ